MKTSSIVLMGLGATIAVLLFAGAAYGLPGQATPQQGPYAGAAPYGYGGMMAGYGGFGGYGPMMGGYGSHGGYMGYGGMGGGWGLTGGYGGMMGQYGGYAAAYPQYPWNATSGLP